MGKADGDSRSGAWRARGGDPIPWPDEGRSLAGTGRELAIQLGELSSTGVGLGGELRTRRTAGGGQLIELGDLAGQLSALAPDISERIGGQAHHSPTAAGGGGRGWHVLARGAQVDEPQQEPDRVRPGLAVDLSGDGRPVLRASSPE